MASPADRIVRSSSERIRVVVAESSQLNGQLIESALQRCRENFEVHAFASESSEAFRELDKDPPHVAIISAQLPDGSLTGFRVLHQLRRSQSKTAAIMLLNSPERDLVVDSFRGGARGVFTRARPFSALPKCICAVHQGQIWVSNDQIELLLEIIMRIKPLQTVRSRGMASLTQREEEVVRLVTEGMRNEEISQKLDVTEHTVRNYLCRVFDKLGLSSRVELVLYALSQ
jgi:two-component system, NarL family, nitrate/nitrite response regulator NarL